MSRHRFHLLGAMGLLGATLAMQVSPSPAAEPYDPWPGLVQDVFNNRPMSDGSDVIGIEMPYRAEDAAIVPVTLKSKLAPDDSRYVRTITLVIDQNPAPMAAKFELGPDARVSEISTRVRVNNYTDVHAVAGDFVAPHYVRFTVNDKPGILAQITAAYSRYGINIEGVLQLPKFRKDRLPFVTTLEECPESVLDRALAEVAKSDYHVQPPLSLPIFS